MITKPTTYTPEFVLQEVTGMLETLIKDPKIIYIGQLFEPKPYSKQRFCEWYKDYPETPEISVTIDRIKDILESRVVVGGITGAFNATMTKFHLVNNYGWRDQKNLDHTSQGEKVFVISRDDADEEEGEE